MAALIVAGAVGGVKGRYDLLRGYLKWRVAFGWYPVVLFSPAIVFAAAIGLDYLLTGRLPIVPAFDLLPSALFSAYIVFTARFMIGNWEEICWRASVLPRLQAKYTALISSLIVGVIQGLWHLPFVFISGHYVQSIGLPAIILQSMAMGIVATWIYNNTRGSLLMVALFHAAFDALSQFQGSDVQLFYLSIGVWCIAAILIVILFGARHFSRKPESEIAYAIISPEN
jgi:membrane protease YdiL (CAAX protease family)